MLVVIEVSKHARWCTRSHTSSQVGWQPSIRRGLQVRWLRLEARRGTHTAESGRRRHTAWWFLRVLRWETAVLELVVH